ncbi:cyclin-dependent kinase inhibitor 1C [Podarcis lilfordi]|uniref:Cyclin-dependent kinase inhibitor 1C n=1 Tax=Podarcis lilfordi TaxID=74358 RepID=A0AA35NTC8_9SAUR|nr:cyclin-dependent kinase inhibitor 1C [Podarcis lilfordi]
MSNVHLSSASALERLAARRTFPLHARTGVCRNLFGPVDHDELNRDLKSKLREICEDGQKRWDYNFQSDTPLGGPGRLQWEEVDGGAVPAFYRETLQVGKCRFPVLVIRSKAPPPPAGSAEAPPEADPQGTGVSSAPSPLSSPGKTAPLESTRDYNQACPVRRGGAEKGVVGQCSAHHRFLRQAEKSRRLESIRGSSQRLASFGLCCPRRADPPEKAPMNEILHYNTEVIVSLETQELERPFLLHTLKGTGKRDPE